MIDNIKFQTEYNFAFIDESTKKEIRQKVIKGYLYNLDIRYLSSPEMPIARGWGNGGLHVTCDYWLKMIFLK